MKASVFTLLTFAVLMSGCSSDSSPFNGDDLHSGQRYLYVASGPCYGGGVTVSTGASNTISKFNVDTGAYVQTTLDYNQVSPGDSPVSIAEYDSTRFLVLVENTGGRRIDIVNKDGSGFQTYLVNTTALNGITRALTVLSDYSLLVSKTTAVEKFNPAKARVTLASNPYIFTPLGSCTGSTTLISSMVVEPKSGKIIYTHAAPSTNNKMGVISATGYAATADCVASQAAPTTTALPTRAIFHSSGKLLVAYGSATAASNFIYSYDFNGTSGAITNATAVFNDGGTIINGPSTMAEDTSTQNVFIANANSTYNTIEKFSFANNALTRATSSTFIPSLAATRCVSDMKVMN